VTPEHREEFWRLDELGFALLRATGDDSRAAERLLDDFVNLLFEGGVLSTWRYRLLLQRIRLGLL